jgi:hypothetical protein
LFNLSVFFYLVNPFLYIILFQKPLNRIFQPVLGKMAHNVPAVYDVFTAAIRALRSKDQGWQNVAEICRGNGA